MKKIGIGYENYKEGILEDGYIGSVSYGICFCKKACIVGRLPEKSGQLHHFPDYN